MIQSSFSNKSEKALEILLSLNLVKFQEISSHFLKRNKWILVINRIKYLKFNKLIKFLLLNFMYALIIKRVS